MKHVHFQKATPNARAMPHDRLKSLKGGTLLLEGAWLLEQFEERLVKKNMADLKLPGGLRKLIIANMTDDTWLALKGPDDSYDAKEWKTKKKDNLVYAMMRNRIRILEATYWQFYNLTAGLGWNENVTKEIADTIIPFIDIGERTCYTYYGHNYRTMMYSEMFLDAIGMKNPARAEIVLGGLSHDIGKAGVPGIILRKNGKPNEAEAKLLKLHTHYGRDILNSAVSICAKHDKTVRRQMNTISEIAFSHQEKFCGEGYPRQRAGEEIAFGARVVAFCDALDAMTSKRLYQHGKPKTFAEARAIAMAEMDQHFNRNIVTNFFNAVETVAGLKDTIYAMIRSCGGNPE
jgi:HD-GYP domain-containing protein (c-di-GMP phosphodiesterase class II)